MHEGGGNFGQYLKWGGTDRRGRGNKQFKKGGKLGQGVGTLKTGGRNALKNYAYIVVRGTITITGSGADDAIKQLDERNKGVTYKSCTPFTDCISKINNTQIDNAKDVDVVRLTYNLVKYSHSYS